MLVYSAGSVEVERLVRMADESGQNNFLFSFANDGARQCARYFCRQPQRQLVIDSGAFSVWNRNERISLQHYISFCKEIQDIAKCPVSFVSLDKIPGSRGDGVNPTTEQSEEACKEGWENYQQMLAAGIKAIPTFHEFDDFKWLFLMLEEAEYIAVSPRKSGVSQEIKMEWLGTVYAAVGLDTKVHGLGIAGSAAMESFPFYSVDSRTWIHCSKGTFRYFDGRRIVSLSPDQWQAPSEEHIWDHGTDAIEEARREYRLPGPGGNYHFMMRALDADARLQRFLTRLWNKRGVHQSQIPDAIDTSYHLDLSDILYKEACESGSWRSVAERRRMDSQYVQWAVNLGRETAEWQAYSRGDIPLELLADRLGWHLWNEQLSTREFYSPRPGA